ncbi:MAG: post-transcriptional regulator [Bacilli bacterium]
MDIEFNSLEELYSRLKPALVTKTEEMHRVGFEYIKEEDVWNYLKEIKWRESNDLLLYQMVSDVLNADNILIDGYLKDKLNMTNRHIYFE